MKFSLIIPMYNESQIIENTITQVTSYLRSAFYEPNSWELLLVSDGSTDSTDSIVLEAVNKDTSHIKLITYTPNHGKGHAVRIGILAAQGDVIAFTDADLAYGTSPLSQFNETINSGKADIAVGSRQKGGYGTYTVSRKLASKLYTSIIQCLTGVSYDSQAGIKAFSSNAAKAIFPLCSADGFAFDIEVLIIAQKRHLSVSEIPVTIINHRQSKIRIFSDAIKMLNEVHSIKKHLNDINI